MTWAPARASRAAVAAPIPVEAPVIRRAAEDLGLSPSALSHRIRGLEEDLGLQVLRRTTRSHSLTPGGRALLERFVPARDDLREVVEVLLDEHAQVRGDLRLNVAPLACRHVLPVVVAELSRVHPDLRVHLVADSALVDIVDGGFDAGVRFPSRVPVDMVSRPLGPPQRFVVVGSPQYLASFGEPSHPTDLLEHRCCAIRFPSGRRFAWEFSKDGESVPVRVPETVVVQESVHGLALARQGAGLAFCSESDAAHDIETGRLRTVLDDWRPSEPGFRLYYPTRRRQRAPLRALVAMLS